MDFPEFAELLSRPRHVKNLEFVRDGRLHHLINASQLTRPIVSSICSTADQIRLISRDKANARQLRDLFSNKRAMMYFTQPSTRTFLSFMAACQIVGFTCNEVRDPKTSSEVKRESKMDAIRMFSSYFDVIVMRSPLPDFAECCAYLMNQLEENEMRFVPIINAGSGSDEHPTQALLDVYTLARTFQFADRKDQVHRFEKLKQNYPDLTRGLSDKTYLFCGDIHRGRTVRSLAIVLSQYENVRMFFVAPQHAVLQLDQDLKRRLEESGVEVREFYSLDDQHESTPIMSLADCVYMTRIQREHNSIEDTRQLESLNLAPFQLTPERVTRMKAYAPIMHPFPRDSQVQEIPEVIDSDPRAMYFRQARNGMWARAALLTHLFDAQHDVHEIFDLATESYP